MAKSGKSAREEEADKVAAAKEAAKPGLFVKAAGAIAKMTDQILKVPDAVRPFVDAFSNAGDRLDVAYKSLYATIGYALEPVIIAASATVERFADAISAGMNLLRGPVEKVAGLFMGVLRPVIARLGHVFESLGKLAEMLTPLLEPVAAVLEAILTLAHLVFTAFGEVVLGLIEKIMPSGKALGEITDWVTMAFGQLALATLRLTDFLLHVVGLERLMIPILEALAKDREGGRRQGKPEGYGISGVEDVYRKRLLAAAGAGGRSVQEESRDYLKELRNIAKELLDEAKNQPEKRKTEREKTGEGWEKAAEGAGGPVLGKLLRKLVHYFRQEDRNSP